MYELHYLKCSKCFGESLMKKIDEKKCGGLIKFRFVGRHVTSKNCCKHTWIVVGWVMMTLCFSNFVRPKKCSHQNVCCQNIKYIFCVKMILLNITILVSKIILFWFPLFVLTKFFRKNNCHIIHQFHCTQVLGFELTCSHHTLTLTSTF